MSLPKCATAGFSCERLLNEWPCKRHAHSLATPPTTLQVVLNRIFDGR